MSSTQTATPRPLPTASLEVRVGRIEFGREGWKLNIWFSFFMPTLRLRGELEGLVGVWLASGQQEFGIPTPPAPPQTSTVFPCWNAFVVGRRIVARPEWGHYGSDPKHQPPEVAEATIGLLSEETDLLSGGGIFAVIEKGVTALSDCGCQAGPMPVRGLRSEVEGWRAELLASLRVPGEVEADLLRLHGKKASKESAGFARLADRAIAAGDLFALGTLLGYGSAELERSWGCWPRGFRGAYCAARKAHEAMKA